MALGFHIKLERTMHYLACNHCGYLNETKSEHLVLCEQCGRKMNNTFSQWKEHHSDGTYEQYLHECSVDGSAIENSKQLQPKEDSKKRKKGFITLALGVTIIVFIGIAVFAYGGIIKMTLQDTFGIGNGLKWTVQHVGTEGLVVNFPKTFENADELIDQIPPTAKGQFEKMEASIAGFNKDFIAIAFTMVKSESDTGNLSRYAELGLEWLSGNRSIEQSSFEIKEYTIGNNPAILQRGTFKPYQDKKISFSLLLTGKDRNFWIIMIVAPESDSKAQRISRKFIRSIEIQKEEVKQEIQGS